MPNDDACAASTGCPTGGTGSRGGRRAVRAIRRGYTAVELMMSMGVLAIGVTGIIAMQNVSASTNRHAKNLAVASHIAEAWLDQLAVDASQWNDTSDFGQTAWLNLVTANNAQWVRPGYVPGRDFGPAFDALGNPVATADFAADAHFCTDLQLTWLFDESRGSGLIRANVRVIWPRSGVAALSKDPPKHACAWTPAEVDSADGRRMFRSVYLSTALRQEVIQ